jgi:GntR family transcriptional regulator/MocR family aminotransferase
VHAPGTDADEWQARALAVGVAFQTASRFTFDGDSRPWMRLGFAACDEAELAEAVRRLREVYLPRRLPRGGRAPRRPTP